MVEGCKTMLKKLLFFFKKKSTCCITGYNFIVFIMLKAKDTKPLMK